MTERLLITADEAEALLADGEYVHNYSNPAAGMFVGCDYSREDAITAFRSASEIEIAGPNCKAMKHPIAVFEPSGRLTFFAADMAKVEAFEAAKALSSPSEA